MEVYATRPRCGKIGEGRWKQVLPAAGRVGIGHPAVSEARAVFGQHEPVQLDGDEHPGDAAE